MRIVGRGFIAQAVAGLAHKYPRTVLFAAGVSTRNGGSDAQYQREADLLFDELVRSRSDGHRFVYISTASPGMYTRGGCDGTEDGPVYPPDGYCRHKLAMERMVLASGLPYLIIRLTHTVGARQRDHQLVPSLIRQIRSGRLTVYRGAHRDVLDIDDAVTFLDHLLALELTGETVNVASGVPVPVEAIVDHLEHRLGRTAARDYLDRPAEAPIPVAKLRRLVPAAAAAAFDDDYFKTVIDRFLLSTDELVPPELIGAEADD
jgi:nucleoside-diphosphate-sugar epimerase